MGIGANFYWKKFRRVQLLLPVLYLNGGLLPTAVALLRPVSRRHAIIVSSSSVIGWWISGSSSNGSVSPSQAYETIGKDPNCNEASCLGIWDGLLADCPRVDNLRLGAGCASSQDDTPGIFAEPWDYSESDSLNWHDQMTLLLASLDLNSAKLGDTVEVVTQEGRYLRVVFTERAGGRSLGEFYFTPNDSTVQFRIAAEKSGVGSLRNIERAERIRKQLHYLKLPVMRNRKQSLLFVESDLDTFGPGSAALGSPSEMRTGEVEGRKETVHNLKIDALQLLPKRY